MSLPVVVLHGFTGTGAAMAPLADRLNRAPSSGEVISPNLAGHGIGARPTGSDEYTIEAPVGDERGSSFLNDSVCDDQIAGRGRRAFDSHTGNHYRRLWLLNNLIGGTQASRTQHQGN